MKVLFFLEPMIERNDPFFRLATIRHSIIPQILALRNAGHDTHFVFGAHLLDRLKDEKLEPKIGEYGTVANQTLQNIRVDYKDWAKLGLEDELDEEDAERIKRAIFAALPRNYSPDVIVIWESAARYFKRLFPRAKVVFQLPGPFSREPFPNYTLMLPDILRPVPIPGELNTGANFAGVRNSLSTGMLNNETIDECFSALRERYKTLLLYPLQIDHYFMIDEVLQDHGGQFGALSYVLDTLPSDTGLIITRYRSRFFETDTINVNNDRFFKAKYPGYINDDQLNRIANVSQLIVPKVDGVITASSSVGFQAALWKKPLWTFGTSHLSSFVTSDTLCGLIGQAQNREVIDQDEKLNYLIKNNAILTKKIASEPNSYVQSVLGVDASSEKDEAGTDHGELSTESELENQILEIWHNQETKKPGEHAPNHYSIIKQVARRRKTVNFDIFDTLLVRPFPQPSNIFDLMANFVEATTGKRHLDFTAHRRAAEKSAFEEAIAAGKGEILISEIYAQLEAALSITREHADAIMQEEIRLETKFLYPREELTHIYNYFVLDGKDINILSDMYLPQNNIKEILEKNRITDYNRLYVSSTVRQKKQSGALFDHYLSETSSNPDMIIHIGDNIVGDVKRPKEKGMKAVHVEKPWDIFERSKLYQQVWQRDADRHSLGVKSMLAIIANKNYEDPESAKRNAYFPNGRYDLGFSGFGPLLLSYVHWLIKTAKVDGVQHLYFLSRDGLIMKQAYDIVASHFPGAPKSTYLYCSRRCANVARLKNLDDLIDLLNIDIGSMTVERLIDVRFGVTPEDIEQQEMPFPEYEKLRKLKLNNDTKMEARVVVQELADLILANAEKERASYLAYLNEQGFYEDEAKAVVDVGYAGTMQESLFELTDRQFALGGYYFVTFRPALERCASKGLPIKGFLADFVDRHDTYLAFCRNVPAYESLFSNDQASVKYVRQNEDGRNVPVFQTDSDGENERRSFTREVHRGTLAFVKRYSSVFTYEQFQFDFEPMKSIRSLSAFFENPSAEDAQLLAGVIFEDNYGGGGDKVILRADKSAPNNSVWRKGDQALYNARAAHQLSSGKNGRQLGWRKIFVAPLRPIVAKMGSREDLNAYNNDPYLFFDGLASPKYRLAGFLFFGTPLKS